LFNWRLINRSPIIVVGTFYWRCGSAGTCRPSTGSPVRKHTIDLPDGVTSADEQALEGT